MKKLLALLLSLVLLFLLCSCTSGGDEGQKQRFFNKLNGETEEIDSGKGGSGAAETISASDLQDLFDNMETTEW